MAATPLHPHDPPDRPEDLKEVVAVARAVIAQEWQITERLETKARQQVALAGQWFAIAQAVLAVALSNDGVDQRWLLWIAAIAGVLSGVAVLATFLLSWKVWRVSEDREVTPQDC